MGEKVGDMVRESGERKSQGQRTLPTKLPAIPPDGAQLTGIFSPWRDHAQRVNRVLCC